MIENKWNMNTKFGIKNFKAFNKEGVEIDLAPITLLTGCNSAGKSSITKAISLVGSYVDDVIKKGYKATSARLNFKKGQNVSLGNFDNVLHRGTDCDTLDFSYSVHSCVLGEDVIVNLTFKKEEKDILNDGYIKSYSIKKATSGEIIYDGENKLVSISSILDCFKDYLEMYAAVCHIKPIGIHEDYENAANIMSQEEAQRIRTNQERLKDTITYMRSHKRGYCKVETTSEAFKGFSDSGTLFYLPAMKELSSCSPDNISSSLNPQKQSPVLDEKVIADFTESGYNTFGEYFKDKEYKFLSGVNPEYLFNPLRLDYYARFSDQQYRADLNYQAMIYGGKCYSEADYEEELKSEPLTFDMVVEFVLNNCVKDDNLRNYVQDIGVPYYYGFTMVNAMYSFVKIFKEEVLSPSRFRDITFVESTHGKVKRIYALGDEGNSDNMSHAIEGYLESERMLHEITFDYSMDISQDDFYQSMNEQTYEPMSFTDKWISEFKIGEHVKIIPNTDGLGVSLKLEKGGIDLNLADEGYGDTQLAWMFLSIESAILRARNLVHEHYILSPNFFTSLGLKPDYEYDYAPQTVIIEEPEIHLHPMLQSKLAEMFLDAYERFNNHFVIETHSEYLIRKFQTLVAREQLKPEDIAIYYVADEEQMKEGEQKVKEPKVKSISINKKGRLTDHFGAGFFDETDSLIDELLEN